MALKLTIKGAEEIVLDEHNITSLQFSCDTPDDSNARSTDVVNTIVVKGKIITAVDGETADDTCKIATWSLVRATDADSYRVATVEAFYANLIVRKVVFPNAFIVDYTEKYGDCDGIGIFELVIRQKKDKFESTDISGGFPM